MDSELRRAIRDVAIVLALFAAAGSLAGWAWHAVWTPAPEAVGANTVGVPVFPADTDFRGTGLYALFAAPIGLLLGAACAWWFDRDELLTLAGVVVGSFAAAWLMAAIGHSLGPADPPGKVTTLEELDGLLDSLRAADSVVWTVLPAAAVTGFFAVLVLVIKREHPQPDAGPGLTG